MTVRFNLDHDLAEQMRSVTGSLSFQALPLEDQLAKIEPILRAQEARDQERLGRYRRRNLNQAVANG